MFLLIVTCLLGQLWQWFDYTNPDISRLHPTVSSHQVQCLWVWESANHIRVQTVSFFQLIVCPSSACSSSSCSSLCLSCSAVGAPFVGCFCCSPALCLLSSAVVCCRLLFVYCPAFACWSYRLRFCRLCVDRPPVRYLIAVFLFVFSTCHR